MKTLIVCVSVAHGNTRRLAAAIADELHATVMEPEEVDAKLIADYDLIGFGSGIYAMSFHRRLREFVKALPPSNGQHTFVFATSGSPELPLLSFTHPLKHQLAHKGFDVMGSFTCRGLDTWGPLQLIGGFNRGRPNDADLDRARRFAAQLRSRVPQPNRPSNAARRSRSTTQR